MAGEKQSLSSRQPDRPPSTWRVVWAIVFVVLTVEAILIAALISSRREIRVTSPIVRVSAGDDTRELDVAEIQKHLDSSWSYEGITIHFHAASGPARNPKAYLDAFQADYDYLSRLLDAGEVKFPHSIFFFDRELDEYIALSGSEGGWYFDGNLYVPALRNPAEAVIVYILDARNVDYDPVILDKTAAFISRFLDFYNDHPYGSHFDKHFAGWQYETQMALPTARVVLDDERLGPDFVSLPVRSEQILNDDSARYAALRNGFMHFLLGKAGWKGFASLLYAGSLEESPFESAYGETLTDLLKEYQEALDLLPKDNYTYTVSKIDAFDLGLLTHSTEAQLFADAEWALKKETKRFRLSATDIADRNEALGELYLRRYLRSFDPESYQEKKIASNAEGYLLSGKANPDELHEIEHRWLVGMIYEQRGEFEEADELFAYGLGNEELREYYLPVYVDILLKRRNFQRAADLLEKFIALHPNDLEALYMRMACLSRIGDEDSASLLAEDVLAHPLVVLGLHPEYALFANHIVGNMQDEDAAEDTETAADATSEESSDA